MYIIQHRTLFFWITGVILTAAISSILIFGLPIGIDFTGGSMVQVRYDERPALSDIQERAAAVPVGAILVRAFGEDGVSVRTRTLSQEEHDALLVALSSYAPATEMSFTSIGPTLGSQFADKALWAVLAVVFVIVLYIAFAFRKVSRPVPSWGYGLTVVAMLIIDIIVPTGFFAAFAHYTGAEVDSLFIVALLALLGYVVNDIIVIFDRVREHLSRNEREGVREDFEITIGKSIYETITRSINTSLTTAFVLIAIIFLGAEATRNFALVMLVGVVAGAFSSITRSAPLLIPIAKWFNK
ncbi:MAG: protein translocase subunit SecF [bacterium]|nr:protein translocase subunit SecF [bacterium]